MKLINMCQHVRFSLYWSLLNETKNLKVKVKIDDSVIFMNIPNVSREMKNGKLLYKDSGDLWVQIETDEFERIKKNHNVQIVKG